MKSLINGFLVSFSMYSVIPTGKNIKWDKNTMKYALCFLPFIGLLIGVAELGWLKLCLLVNSDKILYASVSVVIPIIISGGIHIDGFIDTADAFFSYADSVKRLEIMKDPHIGAFCVIYYGALLLTELGFFSQIYEKNSCSEMLLFIFALSRALSGRMIVSFNCAKNSGLAKAFADNADKKRVNIFLSLFSALIILLGICYFNIFGVCAFILLTGFYFMFKKTINSKFGGITGDLAGCFVTLSEFILIFICCVGGVLL